MTGSLDWQGRVGDNWALEWQRTDRSFAPLSAHLIDHIATRTTGASPRILDIGCGAGGTSLDLAARLPHASIRGIDLSPSLITSAQSRNTAPDRVTFETGDATLWRSDDWAPDHLVSRHGVMFFDDPVAAFTHLAAQSAPDAALTFSCFRARSVNGWAEEIGALLPAQPPADPLAPGPFAFADPDRVASILSAAGWRDFTADPVDFAYVAGAGVDPVADAADFFTRIGPAARAMATLQPADRARFAGDLRSLLRDRLNDGSVTFDAAAWICTANR